MGMKVLIGYDGSDCADAAIEDLHRGGFPADTEALVMSVADVWPHLPAASFQPLSQGGSGLTRRAHALAALAIEEAQRLSNTGAVRIRQSFLGWKVDTVTVADSPPLALIKKAAEWQADVLVVGAQGKSAIGRWVLGSVSAKVVAHAGCSVRVARQQQPGGGAGVRIIVGVDGSSDAAVAISAVAGRTWPAGTEVRVISAVDLRVTTLIPTFTPLVSKWIAGGEDESRNWIQRGVDAMVKELQSVGLQAAPVILDGDPKRVLVDEAERWKAHAIFVGAKGLSQLERFLLGSVSSAVAARAPCSVEVVRFPPA
jgi:nucleotide-binding universal stress UspA family protein